MDHIGINGIVLADLHWGAIHPNRFEKELNSCLFTHLEKCKRAGETVNFAVIAGDTFDVSEYLSSLVTQSVIRFYKRLASYVDQVIVIEGTRSHDALQSSTLQIIFNEIASIKNISFFQTVSKYSLNGVDMLLIPEEYISDPDEYYQDYFNDHYDLIFGHGMTDVIWYAKSNEESVRRYRNNTLAPVFSVERLCEIANYIYFGHIHEHKSYGADGRFKYVGPPTRWEIDKTWDCGFYHITYDKDTKLVAEEFIVNEEAMKFTTIPISINDEITPDDVHRMIAPVTRSIDAYDRIRVILNIRKGISGFQTIKDLFLDKLNQYPNVVVMLKLIDDIEDSKEDTLETPEERNLRVSNYIQTPEDVRIQDFIRKNSQMEIPITTIRDVIGYDKIKPTEEKETC